MKIIQALAWYFPENIGGTEVYAHALAQRFRAAGHEVVIAAPDPRATEERVYEHEGFSVYRYPTPAQPTRDEVQGRRVARGAEKFHAWLARQRARVVHFHTFSTGLGLHEITAAKLAGARVIATTHSSALGFLCQRGTMMRWGTSLCDGICEPAKCAACALQSHGVPRSLAQVIGAMPSSFGILPGRIGTALGMNEYIRHNQRMQREMLDTVDQFVVLTQWACDVLLANGAPPEKIALNRLGYSQAIAPKPGPADSPTKRPVRIGYLGRFEDLKGVHDLARAVAHAKAALIEVEFRGPAGNAREQQVVRELQQIVADDPRVQFAPAIQVSEAPAVLGAYDVLCCPAVCHEGGPTVAIEAHAAGTPVIGTRIGGLAELVADGVNGRLVPPGDWRSLAAVLERIAADPAGTVDRWRLALPRARTMDEVAADYLEIYGRVACYSGASL